MLRQLGIVVVGLAAVAVMVLLGIWQLQVNQRSGEAAAAARAAQPAVALASVAPVSEPVGGDGYGRTVTTSGHYDPATQVLVPTGDAYRVLIALVRDDGSVVPVVRGVVASPDAVPAPPTGTVTATGILMASEASSRPGSVPQGMLGGVQLDVLATRWNKPMIAGFVTLDAAQARAEGLTPAVVQLPSQSGRLRNGIYAVQWWLFAAFAVGMTVKMVRDVSLRRELETLQAAEPDGDGPDGTAGTDTDADSTEDDDGSGGTSGDGSEDALSLAP